MKVKKRLGNRSIWKKLEWTGYLGKFLVRTNENESTCNKNNFIVQQLEKQWLNFGGPLLCASYLAKLVFPKFLKFNIWFWISFKPTEKLQKQAKNSHISFVQRLFHISPVIPLISEQRIQSRNYALYPLVLSLQFLSNGTVPQSFLHFHDLEILKELWTLPFVEDP